MDAKNAERKENWDGVQGTPFIHLITNQGEIGGFFFFFLKKYPYDSYLKYSHIYYCYVPLSATVLAFVHAILNFEVYILYFNKLSRTLLE